MGLFKLSIFQTGKINNLTKNRVTPFESNLKGIYILHINYPSRLVTNPRLGNFPMYNDPLLEHTESENASPM